MFDRSRITPLRRTVAARAGAAGLTGDRLEDFVVAVNELLTNAVRHGGGAGRLTVWAGGDAVVCEVSDEGGGLDPAGPDRPQPDQPGGWGLLLVRRLTDTCVIRTGPGGTAVRISSRIDRQI